MSSQNEAGIPLVHAPDGVGYRLFELPPELATMLESEEPPSMTLESSATSAILKAGTKSWGLRQKNTSNDLIILEAAPVQRSPLDMPQGGLKAIATINETIELVTEPAAMAAPAARGKWHEKFAKGR